MDWDKLKNLKNGTVIIDDAIEIEGHEPTEWECSYFNPIKNALIIRKLDDSDRFSYITINQAKYWRVK